MTDSIMQQQIELQDGRMLGYAEYGASAGVPVFLLSWLSRFPA